jgi:hypothetical protein
MTTNAVAGPVQAETDSRCANVDLPDLVDSMTRIRCMIEVRQSACQRCAGRLQLGEIIAGMVRRAG